MLLLPLPVLTAAAAVPAANVTLLVTTQMQQQQQLCTYQLMILVGKKKLVAVVAGACRDPICHHVVLLCVLRDASHPDPALDPCSVCACQTGGGGM